MSVRGASAELRAHARRLVRGRRRLKFFTDKIRTAGSGKERIQQACYYAQAVGEELDEQARNAFAKELAEVADRRNPR